MKRIIQMASLIAVFAPITACLKDKNIDEQLYGMKGMEDISLVALPNAETNIVLNAGTADTTFQLLTVRLNSTNPAPDDIKVKLVPDNSLVEQAGYDIAPTDIYTLDDLTVTIPKGQREGYLAITTNPTDIAAGNYGFGFRIESVADSRYTISANYRTQLVGVAVRNIYEGTYDVNVELSGHPTASGVYHDEVEFATVNPTTTDMPLGVAGIFNLASRLYVTVDPDTHLLSFESNAAVIFTDPGTINAYDPATRTFTFDYRWGTRHIVGTATRID